MKLFKWINLLFTAGLALCSNSVLANLPVTVSGPTPAIPSTISAGDQSTFVFTITNNVPGRVFPLSISGLSGSLSRTTVPNDCDNILPRGPSQCNVGIMITPTDDIIGEGFNQQVKLDYQDRVPLVIDISFQTTDRVAILTAAGDVGQLGPHTAVLLASKNSGTNWARQTIGGIQTNTTFNSASCTGSGTTAICTAVGRHTPSGQPLLVQSLNSGNTWNVFDLNIGGNIPNGSFTGTGCTGSGDKSICVAVGTTSGTASPLIYQTIDGGSTWNSPSLVVPPSSLISTSLAAASCSGSGETSVCAAVGIQNSTTPFIVVGKQRSNTWNMIPGLQGPGSLRSVSCTGQGESAVCAASGFSGVNALVLMSTDGGNNWNQTKFSPSSGGSMSLTSISCTGEGANAFCVAAGNDDVNAVVVRMQPGTLWSPVILQGGFFLGVSCTGSGANAVCAAVGRSQSIFSPSPIIYVSTDGGYNWTKKTVANLGMGGQFRSVKCTGSGTKAICFATGDQLGPGYGLPYLAQSVDGGNTWSRISNIQNYPSNPNPGGILSGTGATSGAPS